MQELWWQQATSPMKKPPGYEPGGEGPLKLAADQRGQVGAATLPTRGRSIGFRTAHS
jgi:hypothetical protein